MDIRNYYNRSNAITQSKHHAEILDPYYQIKSHMLAHFGNLNAIYDELNTERYLTTRHNVFNYKECKKIISRFESKQLTNADKSILLFIYPSEPGILCWQVQKAKTNAERKALLNEDNISQVLSWNAKWKEKKYSQEDLFKALQKYNPDFLNTIEFTRIVLSEGKAQICPECVLNYLNQDIVNDNLEFQTAIIKKYGEKALTSFLSKETANSDTVPASV